MQNRLSILEESLDNKLEVLGQIRDYNLQQEKSFREETADLDSFDEAIARKDELIEKLTRLDDGFEILYQELAEELKGNREKYAGQIKALQAKIAEVTELSVTIQAQEQRNKKLVEAYFTRQRANISQSRKSSKAAYDYYKSMNGSNSPLYYDSKK